MEFNYLDCSEYVLKEVTIYTQMAKKFGVAQVIMYFKGVNEKKDAEVDENGEVIERGNACLTMILRDYREKNVCRVCYKYRTDCNVWISVSGREVENKSSYLSFMIDLAEQTQQDFQEDLDGIAKSVLLRSNLKKYGLFEEFSDVSKRMKPVGKDYRQRDHEQVWYGDLLSKP